MKLEIEVLGRMYQDWDNEVFSWDMDNLIKISVDSQVLVNKYFNDFTISDEENEKDNGLYESGILTNSYLIDYVGSCSVVTEEGNTVDIPYAYCNLKSEGEVLIKYGKWHLKREIEVAEDFQLSDLVFVRLGNLAEAINSGEPHFASFILYPGKGEIILRELASNIKDEYYCNIE